VGDGRSLVAVDGVHVRRGGRGRVIGSALQVLLLVDGPLGRVDEPDFAAELRRVGTRLGIDDHVCLLGYREDPLPLVARCQIGALASQTEGLPMSLLEAMMREGPGLVDIGVSGYPESHSFIDDDMTIQAMWDKRRIATYIVSNLCFDPRTVKRWVGRVRRRRVELPIHIGMAGVADPAKLLRVSTRIGIVDSARFLKGHSNWFLRMLQPGGYDPERFIKALLPDLAAPERNVAGLHVFTFNEIEPTERWRQEMLARAS